VNDGAAQRDVCEVAALTGNAAACRPRLLQPD
jgi:hypothetical protein